MRVVRLQWLVVLFVLAWLPVLAQADDVREGLTQPPVQDSVVASMRCCVCNASPNSVARVLSAASSGIFIFRRGVFTTCSFVQHFLNHRTDFKSIATPRFGNPHNTDSSMQWRRFIFRLDPDFQVGFHGQFTRGNKHHAPATQVSYLAEFISAVVVRPKYNGTIELDPDRITFFIIFTRHFTPPAPP